MSLNIYKSEVFQGSLGRKNYFEGWYYKHVSADLSNVYSIIPGISLNKDDPHAFIQVLNGITGESYYVKYRVSEFSWKRDHLLIRIGKSIFTGEYSELHIQTRGLRLTGHLFYHNIVKYPKTLLSPGIMGWYSFVPFMECKHGIVSVNHDLKGRMVVNGRLVSFDKGKGYIEKDWGTSFPEAWLWIQANNFSEHTSSFCFSVAKIPWRGKFFIGFIAFLYYRKKFWLFSTYNKSVITELTRNDNLISFTLVNKNYILQVSSRKEASGELMAPVSGEMSRRIKESIDSVVSIRLFKPDKTQIYSDTSRRAGMEVIDKIFDYL